MDYIFDSVGSTFGETKDKNIFTFSNIYENNSSQSNSNNVYNSFSFKNKKSNQKQLLNSLDLKL